MAQLNTYTESEAKDRLCPFMRDWDIPSDGQSEGVPVYAPLRCQASRCMAWKWWDDPREKDKRTGYCGLTGGFR